MRHRAIVTTLAGAIAAVGIAGGAIAVADGGGADQEGSATGAQADRAVAAALAETGGGTANAVERDSEDGAVWEVEVTRPDGVTVDVRLDGNLQVVVVEPDTEAPGSSAASSSED
jgi:uncharacterized membrane protein YkoI